MYIWISSRVTVWLQLFESCTGCQSPRGSSTTCACWFTSRFWDTPEYISDLLTSVANIPGQSTLRASSCGNLVVPRTRRRIGGRAFSVAAPRAWNRLPTELKLLRSTDSFRSWSENISVSFCLRAPGYGLTRPRSSSRGAIQVLQLQLQLSSTFEEGIDHTS